MPDLAEQMRLYFDATTVGDSEADLPVPAARSPRGQGRRVGLLVAAAAIVCAGIVGFLTLRPDDGVDTVNTETVDQADLPDGGPAPERGIEQPDEGAAGLAEQPPLKWERLELDTPDGPISGANLNGGVIDAGDRFVVVHGEQFIDAVSTSFDGVTWTTRSLPESPGEVTGVLAAWEDTLLVTSGGGGVGQTASGPITLLHSRVGVLLPDLTVRTQVFDAASIAAAAVGPAGIVLVTAQPLPDEVGLSPSWYSADGEEWIRTDDFPSGIWSLTATEDGFIGLSRRTAWHSTDGATWREVGTIGEAQYPVQSWSGGVLITDGTGYQYVSGDGIESLPTPDGMDAYQGWDEGLVFAAGRVGILAINLDEDEYLFSQSGREWAEGSLPDEMAGADVWWGWYSAHGAATDQTVLMLLFESDADLGQAPAWWLGTPTQINESE